jgi:ribosomal protein S18 acetylase RimI-like enzyme
MIIREARLADVEAIARVHVDSWRVAYREIIPVEIIQARTLEQRIEQWLDIVGTASEGHAWVNVAVDGNEVVGFVSSRAAGDTDGAGVGEVAAIYVAPRRWRAGAGSALLKAAGEALRAAGFEEATLWVLQDNAPARAFYEREGWAADGASQTLGSTEIVEVRYRRRLS